MGLRQSFERRMNEKSGMVWARSLADCSYAMRSERVSATGKKVAGPSLKVGDMAPDFKM